jgi:hypothetical protein
MTVATNADEMCGAGKELPSCLDEKLGQQDLAWSHAGGDPSWSIARRLGYTFSQAVNVAQDGAQWKDALGQAMRISSDTAINTVFINLGANDVCQNVGHDYTGDLQQIERHIDGTLSYLLTILPAGARIYWTGTPNIVELRKVMAGRRHNYIFRSPGQGHAAGGRAAVRLFGISAKSGKRHGRPAPALRRTERG